MNSWSFVFSMMDWKCPSKTSYNHLPPNVKFYVRQFCTFMRDIDQRTWLQKKEKLPAVPHGRPIKAWRLIFLVTFANRTRDGRTALGQNWPAGWMKEWGKPGSPPSHWFTMVTDRDLKLPHSVKLCSVPPFVQWKTQRFPSFRLDTLVKLLLLSFRGFFCWLILRDVSRLVIINVCVIYNSSVFSLAVWLSSISFQFSVSLVVLECGCGI